MPLTLGRSATTLTSKPLGGGGGGPAAQLHHHRHTIRQHTTMRHIPPTKAFLFGGQKEDEDEELEKMMQGFVFDPSMQRWVRAPNKKIDRSMLVVTPKSGMPYTVWPVMYTYLARKKLKSINQDQALAEMKKGALLLDVRLAMDFENQHAQGAENVPLFRITAGNSSWDNVKRVVMAGLNMKATERDPDFIENVNALVKNNKRRKIIVMCNIGGTLDTVIKVASTGKLTKTDKDRSFGRESRSLKACYELLRAGYKNVVHLEGGLSEWRYKGYPLD
ncbi:Rhodanese-like domain-containing protein 14 [Picochlorum sp. SENEW3]|nr:Rhodanese-like domain-containing protein 14 [Picochlorum sp. SENEW3]